MRTLPVVTRGSVVGGLVLAVSTACALGGRVARPAPFPRPHATSDIHLAASPSAGAVGIASLLQTALAQRGIAYRLGGQDPTAGFDCSGLVRYVFTRHAVEMPRTVVEQYGAGHEITRDQIRAGDLMFFSTSAPGATHVGIALGSTERPEFVHAPGAGGAVRVERFDTPYWRARFIGARRMF